MTICQFHILHISPYILQVLSFYILRHISMYINSSTRCYDAVVFSLLFVKGEVGLKEDKITYYIGLIIVI